MRELMIKLIICLMIMFVCVSCSSDDINNEENEPCIVEYLQKEFPNYFFCFDGSEIVFMNEDYNMNSLNFYKVNLEKKTDESGYCFSEYYKDKIYYERDCRKFTDMNDYVGVKIICYHRERWVK